MDKLKALLKKQDGLKTEIRIYKETLCADKLESLGLKIGDKVSLSSESKVRQGFISSIGIKWNDKFEFTLLAVKKDGAPSKNKCYMFGNIEDYTKVD